MNEYTLALAVLAVPMLLGWILWAVQRREARIQRYHLVDEKKKLERECDHLKTENQSVKSEIERLKVCEEFCKSWNHAPELKEEIEDLRDVVTAIASTKLPEDIHKDIERIGWGITDDSGVDFSDRMDAADQAVQRIVADGKAIRPLDGAPLRQEIAACLLDAFDGYVHFYMCKHGEYAKRVQMVKMAYCLLNLRARDSLHLAITKEYLDAKLTLMRIREEIAEFKRRKRVQDAEMKKLEDAYAEKDQRLNRQLAALQSRLNKAHAAEQERLQKQIIELENQIEANKRTVSNAELTKRGTVYVISNVGSFGENVYKIGMTRRTDPQERVDELGVASVPFPFDVHAFISTDNAPQLEAELHRIFKDKKVNTTAIQGREFYRVSLSDVRMKVEELGYSQVKWDETSESRSELPVPRVPARSAIEREESVPDVKADNEEFGSVESLINYLDMKHIKWVDKRSVGGCFWVISTVETDKLLTPLRINNKRFIKGHTRHFQGEAGWFIT